MPSRIIISNRIIQRIRIPIQPLRTGVIDGVRGDEAGQGRVVVAGAVVQQAGAVAFFAGIDVCGGAAGAGVFELFAEGGVGQAADFVAVGVGDDRGAACLCVPACRAPLGAGRSARRQV